MKIKQLVTMLADGEFHSGEQLAHETNMSRATIWKAVQNIRSLGLDVYAVRGKGYRLANAVQLLDLDQVKQVVRSQDIEPAPVIEIHWKLESTNQHLVRRLGNGLTKGHSCLAEIQTKGRGRRGRIWVSPLGGNIYLSQYWRFTQGPANLSGLSLAMAVTVAQVLQQFQVSDVQLKWPNDIIVKDKKLAGILLEISAESAGPTHVVAGVGLNFRLQETAAAQIDQPYTDLYTLGYRAVDRNRFAAYLISEMYKAFAQFSQSGFKSFIEQWQQLDAYTGQAVHLQFENQTIEGIVAGVDDTGALKLNQNGEEKRYHSGEMSLRKAHHETLSF